MLNGVIVQDGTATIVATAETSYMTTDDAEKSCLHLWWENTNYLVSDCVYQTSLVTLVTLVTTSHCPMSHVSWFSIVSDL